MTPNQLLEAIRPLAETTKYKLLHKVVAALEGDYENHEIHKIKLECQTVKHYTIPATNRNAIVYAFAAFTAKTHDKQRHCVTKLNELLNVRKASPHNKA